MSSVLDEVTGKLVAVGAAAGAIMFGVYKGWDFVAKKMSWAATAKRADDPPPTDPWRGEERRLSDQVSRHEALIVEHQRLDENFHKELMDDFKGFMAENRQAHSTTNRAIDTLVGDVRLVAQRLVMTEREVKTLNTKLDRMKEREDRIDSLG